MGADTVDGQPVVEGQPKGYSKWLLAGLIALIIALLGLIIGLTTAIRNETKDQGRIEVLEAGAAITGGDVAVLKKAAQEYAADSAQIKSRVEVLEGKIKPVVCATTPTKKHNKRKHTPKRVVPPAKPAAPTVLVGECFDGETKEVVNGHVRCVVIKAVAQKIEPPASIPQPVEIVSTKPDFYDNLTVEGPVPDAPAKQEAKSGGSSWTPWIIGGSVVAAIVLLSRGSGSSAPAVAAVGRPVNGAGAGPANPAP